MAKKKGEKRNVKFRRSGTLKLAGRAVGLFVNFLSFFAWFPCFSCHLGLLKLLITSAPTGIVSSPSQHEIIAEAKLLFF